MRGALVYSITTLNVFILKNVSIIVDFLSFTLPEYGKLGWKSRFPQNKLIIFINYILVGII